tara:strand:- start:44 stop:655 length:612 start_codon:yes stop_codon:yes gene_type:complete
MSYVVKTALVGDYGVGKTCIVSRFARNNFPLSDMSTLGVDFDCKIIDFKENSYKIQIWDTAGQEKFQSIVKSYLRDLHICILVFDVNHIKTFQNVKKWLEQVIYISDEDDIVIQLVGNKTDLKCREVSREMINEFCEKNNIDYMECSAKNDENVNDIFYNVIEKIDNLVKQEKIKLKFSGSFEQEKNKKIIGKEESKKCCIIS